MTARKIRFGLIGCGSVSPYHVKAIQKAGNAELIMAADSDVSQARRFARRFGLEAAAGVDELLENQSIEAVSIAVPHHLLPVLGSKAAEAGKHVILEKPVATNCEDAEKLIDTCREAGVKLTVWLERRYQPFAEAAKSFVENGELGRINLGIINTIGYKKASYWNYGFRDEGPYTTWRTRKESSGGGVLIMNAFHQIDLMLFICGEQVSEIYGQTGCFNPDVEVENVATVSMKCKSGALINLTASTCAYGLGRYPLYAARDVICGSEGSCILSVPLEIKQKITGGRSLDLPLLDLVDSKALQVEAFSKAIIEDVPPPVNPEDALGVLRIIRAAYNSAENGSSVKL